MLITLKEYAKIHNKKYRTVRAAFARYPHLTQKNEKGVTVVEDSEQWPCKQFCHSPSGEAFSHTRLHTIWSGMKQRCYNSKKECFARYGGRGVIVCDEWKNSFPNFREWAYKNGYRDDLTIDRIDPSGNYEPSNCRWISKSENSKRTRRIKYDFNNIERPIVHTSDEAFYYDLKRHCYEYDSYMPVQFLDKNGNVYRELYSDGFEIYRNNANLSFLF